MSFVTIIVVLDKAKYSKAVLKRVSLSVVIDKVKKLKLSDRVELKVT